MKRARSRLWLLPGLATLLSILCTAEPGSRATPSEIETLLGPISSEFRPWQASGITKGMVERSYCLERTISSMRFQVKDGRLYVSPPDHRFQSRERTLLVLLIQLSQKHRLPDIDVMFVTDDFCPNKNAPHRSHDGEYDRCPHLAPYFTLSKLPEEEHCIAVPDFTFGGFPEQYIPPWSVTRDLLRDAADNQPWHGRSKTLFWKGGNTHPARKLAVHSKRLRSSSLTQIDFVDYVNRTNYVSLADHCHHKYLLNQEGFSYSSRLKYLMACGSAVIYSDIRYREFWYHMLDESNHMPVAAVTAENDGEPVLKALAALMANDTQAQALGRAGQHLALEVLHPDNVDRYLLEVLHEYSRLMDFEVAIHPDVVPIELVVLRPDTVLATLNRTCHYC